MGKMNWVTAGLDCDVCDSVYEIHCNDAQQRGDSPANTADRVDYFSLSFSLFFPFSHSESWWWKVIEWGLGPSLIVT